MNEWRPVILVVAASTFAAIVVEVHVDNGRYGRAAGFSLFCVLLMLFVLANR